MWQMLMGDYDHTSSALSDCLPPNFQKIDNLESYFFTKFRLIICTSFDKCGEMLVSM